MRGAPVVLFLLLVSCSSNPAAPRVTRARLLNDSGRVAFERGDLEAAAADFETALVEARKDDDLLEKGRALNNLGRVAEAQGHWEQATECYLDALQVSEQVPRDPRLQFTILLNIGSVRGQMGQLDESRRRCEEALALAQEMDDAWRQALALKFIAVLDRRAGNLDQAYIKMSQAYRQFEVSGDRSSQAEALYNLGVILEQREQIKEAMGRFSSAHQIFKSVHDREGIAISLAALARGYEHLEQPRNAIAWYRRAADVNLGIPNMARARQCLQALERLHSELATAQDLEEAAKIHAEIEKMSG